MSFTQAEVDLALSSNPWSRRFLESGTFADVYKENKQLIVDYLTGKTAKPGLIQPNFANLIFASLVSLTDEDLTSPRSQKVLDVLLDPNVFSDWEKDFHPILMRKLLLSDKLPYLESVAALYQKGGVLKPTQLFEQLLRALLSDSELYTKISAPDSPIRASLVNAFRQLSFRALPNPPHRNSSSWNQTEFLPVEEAQPTWITDYIRERTKDSSIVEYIWLAKYNDGKYLELLNTIAHEHLANTTQGFTRSFAKAYALALVDAGRFGPLLLDVSRKYLDHFALVNKISSYESTILLTDYPTEEGHGRYISYSGSAIHFILSADKEEAIKRLESWGKSRVAIPLDVLRILHLHLKEGALPFFRKAFQFEIDDIQYFLDLVKLFEEYFNFSDHNDVLWNLAEIKSKTVREAAARMLATTVKDTTERAIPLLASKKAATRLFGAIILGQANTPEAKEAIANALNKETNDNNRDLLLHTLISSYPKRMDKAEVKAMVAQARERGKLDKAIEPFLDKPKLPGFNYLDGEALSQEDILFLLYRMSRSLPNRIDIEACYLLLLVDRLSAAAFATEILQRFIDSGGSADHKYLLILSAVIGDEDIVDQLQRLVEKWIDTSRFKMAEHAIAALAFQGSNKALRRLDAFSRKYASRKAVIGAAATAALEIAAQSRGITANELGDLIVPDFGFEGLFLPFKAGDEEYRAFIDGQFKLVFFDESNKKLKTVPAAASDEQKAQFKSISKEVKEIVKAQSSRLQFYLIIQRKWTLDQWRELFLENPVMFIYATRLVWGVYSSTDEQPPVKVFICEEDTTLLDENDDEFTPDEDKYIGIIHPSHLGKESLQRWQEKLFDRNISTIFPQLDRKQADLSDVDLSVTILRKFDGIRTKSGSIRSTLESRGWRKGPTGEGGFIDTFLFLDRVRKLEAVLHVEGVGASYGWTSEEKLGTLSVIDKTEKGEALVPFKELPPIFLNELLAAIGSIKSDDAAAAQEEDED